MPKKCSMLECKSNYDAWLRDNPSVSVYKIPTDAARREKWLKIIPRKNWNITVSSVVCIKHFKDKFLERYEIDKEGKQIVYKTPRLKKNAIPTLFGDPLVEVQHSDTEESGDEYEFVNRSTVSVSKGSASENTTPNRIAVIPRPEPPREEQAGNKIKINNTCRVCMKSCRGMQSIYTKRKNYLVVALIANLSGMPIYRNDGLPDEICDSCFVRVYEANETRKLCETSDKKLKNLLAQLKAMDVKDVILSAEAKVKAKSILDKGVEFVSVNNVDPPLIKKKRQAQAEANKIENEIDDFDVTATPAIVNNDTTQRHVTFEELVAEVDAETENEISPENNNEEEDEDPEEPFRFACCMCVNLFDNEEELLAHVGTHEIPIREYQPGKTVECQLCLKRFSKPKNYNNHIKIMYEEKKLCSLCGLSVAEKNYDFHLSLHGEGQTDIIKEQAEVQQAKRTKRRVISGFKKYKCPECDRAFNLNTHLNIHIKAVHLKEKPYQCAVCNSSFAYKDSLNKHSLKHSNERKFKCHLCTKAYIYRADLRVHLQRHENIRNFPCDMCDLKFYSNKHLKQHMITHNPDSIWKCDLCDKSYRQQYTLTKHKFTEHKVPIRRKGANLFGKGYQRCEMTNDSMEEEHLLEEIEEKDIQIEEDDAEYIIQETHYDGEYESVPVVEIPMDG